MVPEQATPLNRDPAEERSLVVEAAESAQVPRSVADSLNALADSRVLPGSVRVHNRQVPLPVEADQEAADLRNYLVWWRQSLQTHVAAGFPEALEADRTAQKGLEALLVLWSVLHPSD